MSRQNTQSSNVGCRAADSTALRSGAGTQQQRQRHDGESPRHDRNGPQLTGAESWIEVSSHPSSSSVSSIGDEIVTTGLQVGSSYGPQRQRLHPRSHARSHLQQPTFVAGQPPRITTSSSQEEYDETESEDDHVLTSSNENITSTQASRRTPLRQVFSPRADDTDNVSDEDDDDDENATALGVRRPSEPFRPQPNAFSHPPSHLTHRHSTSASIPTHPRPSFSQRSQTRVSSRTPSFMSHNYQEDNDAALRASLTTLLSCAAAARGRPKDGEKENVAGPTAGNQPVGLRLVPESELMAPPQQLPLPAKLRGGPSESSKSPTSQETMAFAAPAEKSKRAATPNSGTKSPRATKRKKTAATGGEETFISPTLLTWVVSAGVVVLVSVVGFGAGYVIGREVGRQETLGSLAGGGAGNISAITDAGGSCGRDVIKSSGGTLKRFRWGAGVGRSVAA